MIRFVFVAAFCFPSFALADASCEKHGVFAELRHTLQVTDHRDLSRDAVQLVTTQISGDAQSLLLYGPHKGNFNDVMKAACVALSNSNNALNWIVVASGPPELAFYTDGLLTHTILNPQGSALHLVIVKQLADDLVRVQKIQKEIAPD